MQTNPRTKPVDSAKPPNLEEEIRKRAYELFEARGGENGHEFEDWRRAEEEIMGNNTNPIAA